MSVISRIVYVLVGVSALAQIVPLMKGDQLTVSSVRR